MIRRRAATAAFSLALALPLPAPALEEAQPPAAEQPSETAVGEESASTPEPAPARPATGKSQSGGFWSPPPPSSKAYDWIRLKSGEWLKGEIKRMRDETLHFDSDELDELDMDWDDITALRSPRLHTYVFEGRRIHTGTAAMDEERITVATQEGEFEFARRQLVGIASGDQSERNWWSGELSIGLIARTGNTDSTDLTSRFDVMREAAITRLGLHYNGAISTQNDEQTANNHRANLALDVYVSRRLFVTAPSLAFYRDRFQNIDKQITSGLAIGYDLIKRKKIDWEIGLGAAHQYTQFISVSEDARTARDAAATFATSLDLDLAKDVDWDTDYKLQLVVTDLGLTTQHLLSTLSFEVWGPLDLDVSLTWDRIEQPVPRDDGTIPESDDFRLSVGIGIDF